MQTAHDKLRELRALHEDGLLSRAEFDSRRNAILDAAYPAPAESDAPGAGTLEAAPAAPHEARAGTELGLMSGQEVGPFGRRYRLERLIAQGGMGQVWQATDLATDAELGHSARVALKILPPQLTANGAHARLLVEEAARARALAHEHIVRVYDWAQDPATASHFIIMECLEGEDLDHLLAREGSLGLARTLALLAPVAEALDYAWERHRLVHRDIKPANVFVTTAGEVKLLDFGIAARALAGVSGAPDGALEAPPSSGTAGYRAPEAGRTVAAPAPALDVYAVAVMVYRMLAGRLPFAPRRRPDDSAERPPALDDAGWAALQAGFAFAPEARPASVGALLAQLAQGGVAPAGDDTAGAGGQPGGAVAPAATPAAAQAGAADAAVVPGVVVVSVQVDTGGDCQSDDRNAADAPPAADVLLNVLREQLVRDSAQESLAQLAAPETAAAATSADTHPSRPAPQPAPAPQRSQATPVGAGRPRTPERDGVPQPQTVRVPDAGRVDERGQQRGSGPEREQQERGPAQERGQEQERTPEQEGGPAQESTQDQQHERERQQEDQVRQRAQALARQVAQDAAARAAAAAAKVVLDRQRREQERAAREAAEEARNARKEVLRRQLAERRAFDAEQARLAQEEALRKAAQARAVAAQAAARREHAGPAPAGAQVAQPAQATQPAQPVQATQALQPGVSGPGHSMAPPASVDLAAGVTHAALAVPAPAPPAPAAQAGPAASAPAAAAPAPPPAPHPPPAILRDALLDGAGYGPDLVPLPPGRFQMGASDQEHRTAMAAGSRPGWLARELPRHWVGVERPVALGRFPVTVGEWRVFARATGWRSSGDVDWEAPGFAQTERHPVVGVNWFDAVAYTCWLSTASGRRYRLPSEAEWEYACRAGTRTAFSCGDTIDTEHANYDGSFTYNGGPRGEFRRGTTPVDAFPANPWGLCDMHGNVWEWVQDAVHDNYQGAPVDGSAWEAGDAAGGDAAGDPAAGDLAADVPATGDPARRILRGGSWLYNPRYLRSALRNGFSAALSNDIVGFRVAREL